MQASPIRVVLGALALVTCVAAAPPHTQTTPQAVAPSSRPSWESTRQPAAVQTPAAVPIATPDASRQPERPAAATTAAAWPRLFVVVFERRVPMGLDAVGTRLGILADGVAAFLTGPDGARAGDHVVVFSEGMSQNEWPCMLSNTSCGPAQLEAGPGCQDTAVRAVDWTKGAAAVRDGLSYLLRLPGSCEQRKRWQRGEGGVEFAHVRIEPSTNIRCLLAAGVTGPLTREDGLGDCPAEGRGRLEPQTRAFSRVEFTGWLQIEHALAAVSSQVSDVTWVWALLRDKRYSEIEARIQMERDFGVAHAVPALALFDAARAAYHIRERSASELALVPAPGVRVHTVTSVATETAHARLEASHDVRVEMAGGQLRSDGVDATIDIARSQWERRWRPALDSLALRVAVPDPGTRLLAGAVSVSGPGLANAVHRTLVAENDGLALAADPELDASLARARADGGGTVTLSMQLLVAGRADSRFKTIPTVVAVKRTIQLGTRAITPIEWSYITGGTVLFMFALGMGVRMVRPFPFEVIAPREPLHWVVGDGRVEPRTIELQAYSTHIHRQAKAVDAELAIEWAVFDNDLPTHSGTRPVRLRLGDGEGASREGPTGVFGGRVRFRLGSAGGPRAVGLPIAARLAVDDIAFEQIPGPRAFTGVVKLSTKLTPAWSWLPLLPLTRTLFVPVTIDVKEDVARPRLEGRVYRKFKFLGLDAKPGSAPEAIMPLAFSNRPASRALAREIRLLDASVVVDGAPGPAAKAFTLVHHEGPARVIPSGATSGWHLEFDPAAFTPPPAVPIRLSGLVRFAWQDARTSNGSVLERPFDFTWIPMDADSVGLDLGTSGARLWFRRRNEMHVQQVPFPLSPINDRDTSEVPEFPAQMRVSGDGHLLRVGLGRFGVMSARPPSSRTVESPKAVLLRSLRGSDAAAVDAARRDLERYVEGLARSWAQQAEARGIGHVKIIATIPASYDKPTELWYVDILRRHFGAATRTVPPAGDAAIVTTVKEAEAAAYYYLVGQLLSTKGAKTCRVAVVDMGAGTTDFVIVDVEVRDPQDASPSNIRVIASDYSHAAGDRCDELIAGMFPNRPEPHQLTIDLALRDRVRGAKRQITDGGREHPEQITVRDTDLGLLTTTAAEVEAALEPFFVEAIVEPLTRLRDSLPAGKRSIDEVLIAGRGAQVLGCRTRIMREMDRLFKVKPGGVVQMPERERLSPDALQSAIAKGALRFEQGGPSMFDDREASSRDAFLLLNEGDRPRVVPILQRGEQVEWPVAHQERATGDLMGAWVVVGHPTLTEARCRELFQRLIRGDGSPGSDVYVAASLADLRRASGVRVTVDVNENVLLKPEFPS